MKPVQVKRSTAEVIEDSISREGVRITTLRLRYPRIIHSELMTHRMFSRNAQSSRATPVRTLIESVRRDPYFPTQWNRAQKGMVPGDKLTGMDRLRCEKLWREALESALDTAEQLADIGAAKEQVNRLLEPFSYINVLVTATDWQNFFDLRLSSDAQLEIQHLARAMKLAMKNSLPVCRQWHLPFVPESYRPTSGEGILTQSDAFSISAARCARVSYLRFDGKEPSIEDDVKLTQRLYASGHMTPFEHAAIAVDGSSIYNANFRGWFSMRYAIERMDAGAQFLEQSENE